MMSCDQKVNILLVDDNPNNLIAYEGILERLGQNIVKASSGKEALRFILDRDFALVILDVVMPGMDGFDTARMIRERQKSEKIPIIFVTAWNKDDKYISRGYSLGAVDYIFAPVNPEILRTKVKVFIDLYRKLADSPSKEKTLFIWRWPPTPWHQESMGNVINSVINMPELEGGARLNDIRQIYRRLFEDSPVPLWEIDYSEIRKRIEILRTEGIKDLKSYLDGNPEAVKDCISKLKITAMNRATIELPLSGIEEDHLNFRGALFSMKTFDTVKQAMSLMAEGGGFFELESEAITQCGKKRSIITRWIVPGRYESTNTPGFIAAVDITELVSLQEELMRKNREMEDFSHRLGHNMKTSLMVIKRLAEMSESDPDIVRRFSTSLVENSNILINIVDRQFQLINLSRAIPGKKEMNLEPVISDLFERMKLPDVGSRLEIQEGFPPLTADPGWMEKLFTELLSNSFKYRDPEKKEVSISLTYTLMDEWVAISFRDNGLGIRSGDLDHSLSAPFKECDDERGGLGLAIAAKIVESHGGALLAKCAGPRCGTEIIITLPDK